MIQEPNFKLNIDFNQDGRTLREQPDKNGTPPEGAGNTNRGLTTPADVTSEAAAQNPTPAISSRQLLPSALDDFLFPGVIPDEAREGENWNGKTEAVAPFKESDGINLEAIYSLFIKAFIRTYGD